MEEDEGENESERGGENEGVKVSRKLWRECEEKERKEELRTPVRKRVEGSVQRSKVVHQNDSLVFFFFFCAVAPTVFFFPNAFYHCSLRFYREFIFNFIHRFVSG